MKTLLSLVLLLTALTASASPGQPYFAKSRLSSTGPDSIQGLYMWFKASSFANDGPINAWTDVVSSVVFTQTLASLQPIKTNSGILFGGTRNFLTNGVQGVAGYHYVIFNRTADNSQNTYAVENPSPWTGHYFMLNDNGVNAQTWTMARNAGANLYVGCLTQTGQLSDYYAGSVEYTNGVPAINWGNDSLITLGGIGGQPLADCMKGYIYELLIFTNDLTAGQVAFMHNYATNTYWNQLQGYAKPDILAQPSSVICLTNEVRQFSISATGNPSGLTFQWRTNGVSLANSTMWAGTTTSNLWVTNGSTLFSNLPVQCAVANVVGTNISSVAYLNVVTDTNLYFGLTGWWKFDDGSGGTALDSTAFLSSTASVHNGTLTNSPTWITNGAVGGALQLNGSSQSVGIGTGALTNVNNFTIASWVNPAADAAGGEIFSDYGQARCLGQEAADCFAEVSISSQYRLVFGPSIRGTGWRHLTMVKSSTAGLSLYIDGTLSTNNATYTGDCSVINNNQTIGMTPDNQFRLKGSVDEVRVYNRALSATEITNLFNWRP